MRTVRQIEEPLQEAVVYAQSIECESDEKFSTTNQWHDSFHSFLSHGQDGYAVFKVPSFSDGTLYSLQG